MLAPVGSYAHVGRVVCSPGSDGMLQTALLWKTYPQQAAGPAVGEMLGLAGDRLAASESGGMLTTRTVCSPGRVKCSPNGVLPAVAVGWNARLDLLTGFCVLDETGKESA